MDSNFFLSEVDLQRLTGRLRPKSQCNWLLKNGWKFTVNALGQPIVAINEAESRLVGGLATKTLKTEPNWEVLHGQKT